MATRCQGKRDYDARDAAARQIAPAYNKGALQYLPNSQKDEWPDRDEQIASWQTKKPLGNRKRVT
jgi:hypothetical protein